MIFLRWIWFLLGVGVTLYFVYLFAMTVLAAMGLVTPPTISTMWLALALSGAALFSMERNGRELEKL